MTNLPVIVSGLLIVQLYGFINAVVSLIASNLILAVIRFTVARVAHNSRMSTLDLSRKFLGNRGAIFIAFVLLFSTLILFTEETSLAGKYLSFLFKINEGQNVDLPIQFGVGIGILSTLLCMEGIVALRRSAVIFFPLIILLLVVVVFLSNGKAVSLNEMPFSWSSFSYGTSLMVATGLGITADLPTFFRHRRSWRDSVIAIIYIQIIMFIVGFLSLYLGMLVDPVSGLNISDPSTISPLFRISLIMFILISTVFANVANIYSASVGWEALAPKSLIGRGEYLILGLGLVASYVSFTSLINTGTMLSVSEDFLVLLCVLFIAGYFIQLLSKKSPSSNEQLIYIISFVLSSVLICLQEYNVINFRFPIIVAGVSLEIFVLLLGFLFKKILFKPKLLP
ncbi:MAG: hypothetical protein ChlgKO_02780 [Chlamydiales bacterium]